MFNIKRKWRVIATTLLILFWVVAICYVFGEWHLPPMKRNVPKFIKRLHNEDAIIRRDAASSLALIGPDAVAAVPDLIKALDDRDSETRRSAAWALANIGPGARVAVPALIDTLDDPEAKIRGTAALALGVIGPEPGVLDALISSLDDEEEDARILVLNGLGYLGADAEAALPRLEELLAHTAEGSYEHEIVRHTINEIKIQLVNREFNWD